LFDFGDDLLASNKEGRSNDPRLALPIGENLTRITKGIYPVSYLSALGLCVGRYAMRGKLCLKDRELQKSRVIPGFFFKPPYLLARVINTFLRA